MFFTSVTVKGKFKKVFVRESECLCAEVGVGGGNHYIQIHS